MRHGLAVVALTGMALALASCNYDKPVEPYRPPAYYPRAASDVADPGRYLYARDCSFCHGDDGRGTTRAPGLTAGTNGPALNHFVLATGRMPINSPDDPMRHRESRYTPEDIAALATYMDERFDQPGPDIPVLDLAEADLADGEQLYQEHCAACHASTAIGGAMLATRTGEGPSDWGIHIPGLEQSTDVEIAEAIRTGPGTMPVFGTETISDEEVESIVRYATYLKDPLDAGGAPIGRVGPVAEGAVGWIVGVGGLLLLVRWIGTKAGETR